jgi:hypothetical protein
MHTESLCDPDRALCDSLGHAVDSDWRRPGRAAKLLSGVGYATA